MRKSRSLDQTGDPRPAQAGPRRDPLFPHYGHRSELREAECGGRRAVRKTFYPGYERHLEREVFARSALRSHLPEIAELLEHGPDYVVSPRYHDVLRYDRRGFRLFPLDVARRVVDILERLYELGYVMLDIHPCNVLVDRDTGLKLVDLEFLQPYGQRKPDHFLESWDLVGPPGDFQGDVPRGNATTWERHWHPYVGLTVQELRQDAVRVQHLKRMRHWLFTFLPRQLDHHLPYRLLKVKSWLSAGPKWLLRISGLIR